MWFVMEGSWACSAGKGAMMSHLPQSQAFSKLASPLSLEAKEYKDIESKKAKELQISLR